MRPDGESAAPIPLRSDDTLGEALVAPLAVIYKHSPLCGLSSIAAREVERFLDEAPEVPVYHLDVIRDRPLAREVARRLDVRHESPQVIVVRQGQVAWDASHREVTAEGLRDATAG